MGDGRDKLWGILGGPRKESHNEDRVGLSINELRGLQDQLGKMEQIALGAIILGVERAQDENGSQEGTGANTGPQHNGLYLQGGFGEGQLEASMLVSPT